MDDKKEFKKELMVINDLMNKLCSEMEYDEDDFMERLGKKKPAIAVTEIKTEKMPLDGEMMGMEDEDDEMEGDDMFAAMGEESDPDEDLKKRLLKLRG